MKNIKFLIIGLTGPLGAGCTTVANTISRLSSLKDSIFLEVTPDEKVERFSKQMEKAEVDEDNKKLEIFNKKLHDALESRVILKEIQKFNDPKFQYISMSTMIVLIAIKNIKSSEFETWRTRNIKIGELIFNFGKSWEKTVSLYNDKEFLKFTEKEVKNTDAFFVALEDLKNEIKIIEHDLLFSENISEYILQSFGSNIRKNGNPFNDKLHETISEEILYSISRETSKYIKYIRKSRINEPHVFIIDAFRNPVEINYFRKRFAQFYLVSLIADEKVRHERTKKTWGEEIQDQLLKKLDKQDLGLGNSNSEIYKQNVEKCCYLADISINNNDSIDTKIGSTKLYYKLLKYYTLMISPGCIKPTEEEMKMHLAYSLSLRSTCISRKVGAVIADKDGYIIGLGWNDVAHTQIGCGLIVKKDLIDKKLFQQDLYEKVINLETLNHLNEAHSYCFKDVLSKTKILEIIENGDFSDDEKTKIIQKINNKRLEYCRALHAEENALLQVASKGGMGVKGGTIYTTTFPCELCAKKISQSGIENIYYTEPYPNSISENVFLKSGIKIVRINQFEGIKSSSYFRLYKAPFDKKEEQEMNIV